MMCRVGRRTHEKELLDRREGDDRNEREREREREEKDTYMRQLISMNHPIIHHLQVDAVQRTSPAHAPPCARNMSEGHQRIAKE